MLNPPPSELQLSSFPVQADGNRYIPIHGDYFSGEAEIFFIEMTNPPLSGWIAAWDQVAVVSPNLMYLVVPEDQHLPPGGVDALVGVVVKKWWLEEYSMESEFFPISVRP